MIFVAVYKIQNVFKLIYFVTYIIKTKKESHCYTVCAATVQLIGGVDIHVASTFYTHQLSLVYRLCLLCRRTRVLCHHSSQCRLTTFSSVSVAGAFSAGCPGRGARARHLAVGAAAAAAAAAAPSEACEMRRPMTASDWRCSSEMIRRRRSTPTRPPSVRCLPDTPLRKDHPRRLANSKSYCTKGLKSNFSSPRSFRPIFVVCLYSFMATSSLYRLLKVHQSKAEQNCRKKTHRKKTQ